jgi:hypothetical protein
MNRVRSLAVGTGVLVADHARVPNVGGVSTQNHRAAATLTTDHGDSVPRHRYYKPPNQKVGQ